MVNNITNHSKMKKHNMEHRIAEQLNSNGQQYNQPQ
jgi:hypothetical protein